MWRVSGLAAAGCLASVTLASVAAVGAVGRSGERPVMKVVRLLEDMRTELSKELEDDKQVHEMLTCWCKTNSGEKATAIQVAEATSVELKGTTEEALAKVAELKEKRRGTLGEVDANHAAVQAASAMRMKEVKEFRGEEKDLIEAITACKQAVNVLSKHKPELAQVLAAARALQAARVPQLLEASRASRARSGRGRMSTLKGFLEQATGAQSFLSTSSYSPYQSYAPQSGQIFGILRTMVEDFEVDLSTIQKAEQVAVEDHVGLKAAKEDELAAGKKSVVQLDGDIALLTERHAQAEQQLLDVQAQLELDRAFVADLNVKCAESKDNFDARVKSRMEEIAAVEETVTILNTDTAFDVFDKTVSPASFIQVAVDKTQQEQQRRKLAAAALQRAASLGGGDAKVAKLATSVQMDVFAKVAAEIDKIVAELGRQQSDEVSQRDWCTEEFAANGRSNAAGEDKKQGLETKMTDLETSVEKATQDITRAEAENAEAQKQMQRASEAREAENADFQQTVTDQRLTQMILLKAIARMKQVYALVQQPGAPHVLTSATHTDAGNGPARFTKYEENAAGSKVVAMLETVLTDSKKLKDEAITSEMDSQAFYENYMQASNKAVAKGQESMMHMSGARAKAKGSFAMAQTDLRQTVEELGGLSEMLGDLHGSCDFVLRNFEARQAARAAEMEALAEAKAILSGMN